MLKPREILLYLSLKYEGNWFAIFNAVNRKEDIVEKEARELIASVTSNYATIFDKEYPKSIYHMTRPPFVIYYYGDLSLVEDYTKCLSVVGTRKCSEYGAKATSELVKGVANSVHIVSGMADGIDSVAHRSAIDAGGKTIAVLGCGIDYIYPNNNFDLYQELKQNHLIISEYPKLTVPIPANFPFRNRIIACLSQALLVTECYKRSGTSTTVASALANDRDVLTIPYPLFTDSECNRLLKDGAQLIETSDDILEILGKKLK